MKSFTIGKLYFELWYREPLAGPWFEWFRSTKVMWFGRLRVSWGEENGR